ncbi:sigma-70 family RNA polymerase sigma factor [Halobacillus shinanisalinarum]|uniref:Sigma-70 family RNA polymerase sigma factor n=1 Tax=Halobacillus shinanisalinarum TaxID=2932258 RepID=A0ABY4GVA4_9BACI|nr:sigma-70 family RNA polymerase sigma factor [Halobacillus shinanisalinarum]UOQ92096.1 sigma-70 family RNA polymerase sigma factor [Halobacillus shinanisalinarum]
MIKKPLELFLQDKNHYEAVVVATKKPTSENRSYVNQLFYHYQIEARFVTYINTVLWRYAKDYQKKRKTWRDWHVLKLDQSVGEDLTVLDVMADKSIDLNRWGEERDPFESVANRHLHRAIGRLPSRQRRILKDHIAEQMTLSEIASKLGVSQQSVSKSFHRMMRKLLIAYQKGE